MALRARTSTNSVENQLGNTLQGGKGVLNSGIFKQAHINFENIEMKINSQAPPICREHPLETSRTLQQPDTVQSALMNPPRTSNKL